MPKGLGFWTLLGAAWASITNYSTMTTSATIEPNINVSQCLSELNVLYNNLHTENSDLRAENSDLKAKYYEFHKALCAKEAINSEFHKAISANDSYLKELKNYDSMIPKDK